MFFLPTELSPLPSLSLTCLPPPLAAAYRLPPFWIPPPHPPSPFSPLPSLPTESLPLPSLTAMPATTSRRCLLPPAFPIRPPTSLPSIHHPSIPSLLPPCSSLPLTSHRSLPPPAIPDPPSRLQTLHPPSLPSLSSLLSHYLSPLSCHPSASCYPGSTLPPPNHPSPISPIPFLPIEPLPLPSLLPPCPPPPLVTNCSESALRLLYPSFPYSPSHLSPPHRHCAHHRLSPSVTASCLLLPRIHRPTARCLPPYLHPPILPPISPLLSLPIKLLPLPSPPASLNLSSRHLSSPSCHHACCCLPPFVVLDLPLLPPAPYPFPLSPSHRVAIGSALLCWYPHLLLPPLLERAQVFFIT